MLRGISYYQDFAKKMKGLNLSDVVLVTGDHKIAQRAALKGPKSKENAAAAEAEKLTAHRLKQVQKTFEREGMKVTQRVNHNADCDLIYMSNAKRFVVAGGTYSRLISMMVKLNGGQVWGHN